MRLRILFITSVTRELSIMLFNVLLLLECTQSADTFFPLIYGPLGEWILSNIQPNLHFHYGEVVSSSYFRSTCIVVMGLVGVILRS